MLPRLIMRAWEPRSGGDWPATRSPPTVCRASHELRTLAPLLRGEGGEHRRCEPGEGPLMRGPDRKATRRVRQLRTNATDAETKLWFAVRDRRLAGFKFVRQKSIGLYVVDF